MWVNTLSGFAGIFFGIMGMHPDLHFISIHFIIFIQGKYSSHKNVDLQTALLQKKSYKITGKIGALKYVKVKERGDTAQDLSFFSDDLNWMKVLAIFLSLFKSFKSLAHLYEKHFWPNAVCRRGT